MKTIGNQNGQIVEACEKPQLDCGYAQDML
jgi:hypothetical protein